MFNAKGITWNKMNKFHSFIELLFTFLSLRVFGLLSSSLFPQRFGLYVLQPSSVVCWTREPSRNFESTSFIESTGVAPSDSVSHNRIQELVSLYCYTPAVRIEPTTSRWLSPLKLREPTPITVTLCVLEWIFGTYKLNVLTWLVITFMYNFFYMCSYSDFFLHISYMCSMPRRVIGIKLTNRSLFIFSWKILLRSLYNK